MTDRAKFEQMLESLINGDQKQAEEIFHDLVVAKSREIYENLLDDDIQVDEEKDEDEDEDVEENFDMDMQEVGGDPADNMMGDMEADEEGDDDMGDEGGDEAATKDDVMDIKDALDDLKAEFEAMLSGNMGDNDGDGDHDMDDHDAEGDDDMGDMDDEEEKKEGYQFEEDEEEDDEGVVREYVEKVAPAKMGDNGANNKSIVAGKNNMGGTTANIVKGGTEAGVEANKGHLKGSSLFKGTPKDLNSGNVNVPGSKNATKMSPTKGHGAEKKGAGEQAANTRSIVGK
jgi:hypothetical protein